MKHGLTQGLVAFQQQSNPSLTRGIWALGRSGLSDNPDRRGENPSFM